MMWYSGKGLVCLIARALPTSLLLLLHLCAFAPSATALRPLRETDAAAVSAATWHDEHLLLRSEESDLGPYSAWNITGTYRGRWTFSDDKFNLSSSLKKAGKTNGVSVIELVSNPTKINGVHYVQGAISFHDVYDTEQETDIAQMRVEGVYIWPFRQLRLVANSMVDEEAGHEEDYFLSHPYHLLGVFSSHVFQESSRDVIRRKRSLINGIEKRCNLDIMAKVSRISSGLNGAEHERYHLEGVIESTAVDDDRECFSSIELNATSLNIEVYYNKAVNYTLMVTFVSFLQVLLLIRQMEHSNTQSGAAKVSILMIGQQAIMDAYLCLLHLTAGILVGTCDAAGLQLKCSA